MKDLSLKDRILLVKERIQKAAVRSGRNPDEISLVVVTKEADDETVLEALSTGLVKAVGENRVQSLLRRLEMFKNHGVSVHMIGRLQTNKVRKIIGKVDLIHSLDRESLAAELSKRAAQVNATVDVLIEVNTSGEETKAGVSPDSLIEFAEKVSEMKGINLRGLMMMAPFILAEECRPYFRKTFELFDKLKNRLGKTDFDILSMGMSNDFEVAIEEGSNMVRIGSLIFKP